MKTSPSREQLSKSLDRRVKHLMIRMLEKFEDTFPELEETRDGRIFKTDIRNAFNDVMRAQRDEIRDYDVEYRPLRLTDDNTLAITQTFMRTVQKVDFGFTENQKPYIEFYGGEDSMTVLNALRSEMDSGILLRSKDGWSLLIVGKDAVVNSVLSIMDRYRLHGNVAPEYSKWRDEVVRVYRS